MDWVVKYLIFNITNSLKVKRNWVLGHASLTCPGGRVSGLGS